VRVYLVNPSHLSFGAAIATPRWLYVIAGATPASVELTLIDETLERADVSRFKPGDVVGIGIHTLNALRGYEVGQAARARGAFVVFGGVHTSLYPDEVFERGVAHAIDKVDGEVVRPGVLADYADGHPGRVYEGGRVEGEQFVRARWDLLPNGRYMFASVQTVRGCPKHCSFCSVWRTDGQRPRTTATDAIIEELVQLRRMGIRFATLADDNFYPVTLEDLRQAERRKDPRRLAELTAIRAERFELMERLAQLPDDMILFTQITMEAAEDPAFLRAMQRARIKGTVVGIEAVTPEGLKNVMKGFNSCGDELVKRLRAFKEHGIHVLGSFIFGLPSDRDATFDATVDVALKGEVSLAQFCVLQPFPGTIDFQRWEEGLQDAVPQIDGIPLTRYWLIPQTKRPKLYTPHPVMSSAEVRDRTQKAWDRFYTLPKIWKRAHRIPWRGKLLFIFMSKLYRQMYANTGIATDSARVATAESWARWLAERSVPLFMAKAMPDLEVPRYRLARASDRTPTLLTIERARRVETTEPHPEARP
jgi:radical SAM superfamily enzyme YgiQ (UPF0313 family)